MILTIDEDCLLKIPAEILTELDIEEGDTVEIDVELIDDVPCIVLRKYDESIEDTD